MGALRVGETFRDFHLDEFDSAKARSERPLVVLFWRIGCPTSRLAVPFFDRIQSSYPDVSVVGVAQETESALAEFVSQTGLSFRQLADADLSVSKLYDLDVVPTCVLTDETGTILASGQGWSASEVQGFGDRIADRLGVARQQIILESDAAPAFKPG